MESIIATIIILLLAGKIIWKYCFIVNVTEVPGGYKHDVIVPHSEPIEFYYADISTNSMKVRFCLAEANIKYKSHLKILPNAGSFETKSSTFLRINPAGTVPVLVHNGHPIHESSEQIMYIGKHLTSPGGPLLLPHDPKKRDLTEYWVEKTAMYASEIMMDMTSAWKRRVGNLIPFISLPPYPHIAKSLSWKTILHGLLIRGSDIRQVLQIIFFILGEETFKIIPSFASLVKKAKIELLVHLKELENHLRTTNTTFICSEDITLADIGWAPILERLDFAGWWPHIDTHEYRHVIKYWTKMRDLASYKEAVRPVGVEQKFIDDIKSSIAQWKKEYPWFKSLYE